MTALMAPPGHELGCHYVADRPLTSCNCRRRELEPGDIGFTNISGLAGAFVGLGQLLVGDACRYHHVFLVIDNDQLVEAMPGGARIQSLDRPYEGEHGVQYMKLPLLPEQRDAVAEVGRRLVHTQYSYSQYPALAMHRFGVRPGRLERYIADSGRMICSQLVDEALLRVGYHFFDDGLAPGDVTPGDLYYGTRSILELDGSRRFGESGLR